MGKVTWRGGAMMAPVPPVMVTCGEGEEANIVTVAWTGILNTIPPKTYISLRPSRHSYGIIRKTGEFVINLTTADLIRAADFCGVRSGADLDKFAVCGLERAEASAVGCPLLAKSPVCLECRVTEVLPLGSHDMFLADVVAVDVEETLLDDAGKLHLERAGLAAYAHGEYYALGEKLGSFGFSVEKKSTARRRAAEKNGRQGARGQQENRKKRPSFSGDSRRGQATGKRQRKTTKK